MPQVAVSLIPLLKRADQVAEGNGGKESPGVSSMRISSGRLFKPFPAGSNKDVGADFEPAGVTAIPLTGNYMHAKVWASATRYSSDLAYSRAVGISFGLAIQSWVGNK